MQIARPKLRFEIFGYYFIGLFLFVFLAFWPSYFSKFFYGTANFSNYFHVHVIFASLWIVTLIVHPILIQKKRLQLHRTIGKLTYILFPLLCLSILLLAHSRHQIDEKNLDLRLFVTFGNLTIFITAYWIAIRYRHKYHIHARAMIVTGLAFIDPTFARFISHVLHLGFPTYYLWTIATLYLILISLMVVERKQKKGRWVFPSLLGLYVIYHTILIFKIHIAPWEAF